MSRWNKTPNNRFPQTVVPLDNLMREKENKNSVAVGTVMKFGMMQFTSIRSSCYNMGALSSTSPIQNAASSPTSPNDLNDTKISVETTPKPRKFFKSRNNAPPAEIQQQMAMQQQLAMQQQQQQSLSHNNHIQLSDDHTSPQKQAKKKQSSPKKEKVDKPKVEKPPKPEKPKKPPKEKKEKPPKVVKAPKSVETADSSDLASPTRRGRVQVEPTRASGRNRGKVNYNEDQGEEEFLIRTEKRVAPRHMRTQTSQESATSQVSTPLHSPSEPAIESPIAPQADAATSSNQSSAAAIHPPIVLRISKGTSRLVSTDNEDGVKSPTGNSNSDENKNVVNSSESVMASTDELIAVLSGDSVSEPQPEQKTERIRIRIKKDYIRSYNDSLREQEAALAKTETEQPQQQPQQINQPVSSHESSETSTNAGRVTRRRGKIQEAPQQRNSPIVSEFDSQSSVLGSTSSHHTISSLATTSSSNINNSNEDCKVIHSRGSSGDITTSDMDVTSQQSSMAAAPPSSVSRIVSENTSSNPLDAGSQDDEPVVQKGRRGRKRNNNTEELKPPEPVPERTSTRTRNTRNNKTQQNADSSPSSPEKPAVSTRSTRNTRHNNASNNTLTPENSTSTNSSNATTLMPAQNRFFTRKRKNVESEETPAFVPTENDDDDQMSALNLSQKSAASTVSSSDSVTEYKHKKLVKRSWEQEKTQQQQQPNQMEVDQPVATSRSPSKQANNNHAQKPEDSNPGVKLLISKKKGSIFKSRALDKDEDNNKKRHNLYKHKWEDDDDELMEEQNNGNAKPENLSTANSATTADSFFDGEPSGIARFTRNKKTESVAKESALDDDFDDDVPIAGLRGDRNSKDYYQVVRNVKKAHQIQEIGEFQEMDDDVEYLLDALQPSSQVALRCLSALQLASKCMTPSFRMHIRAHGIVPKFFKALEDAPNDASLGLCTAMVMFALSQDTLKMDLDRGSLELMLNLLECEGSQKQYPKDVVMNKQHMERKQKVRELCEEIQSQGKSIHLNLDNITAAQLAMESLLSLTSKRAGEWLKEDLRELGGIEHIIRTVCECCNQISEYVEEWTEPLLEKLNKTGRCLRIVENVTSNNEENQKYILHYKSQVFVKTMCKFYNLLSGELTLYPTTEKSAKDFAGVTIRETLLTLLKVIVNLTHPFNDRAIGSVLFGDYKDIFQISISSLLFGVSYVSSRFQFDFSLLTLVLLNNLTQLNEKNQQSIMQLSVPVDEFGKEKQPALKSLIEYFYKCQDKAKTLKKLTDDLIDNSKQRDAKQEEAVNALIQNSGTHMENTILGSFTSTLLGFVIMNNSNNEVIARRYLRDGQFKDMLAVLMQYYEFLNLTVSADASSMAQLKTIKNVMDFLRNCDAE